MNCRLRSKHLILGCGQIRELFFIVPAGDRCLFQFSRIVRNTAHCQEGVSKSAWAAPILCE